MREASQPIRVTILTGFLGSGKTRFLNRLLQHPSMADAMVLINEFGEVGLDHLLVEAADDHIIELSNGCLCCSIRGALSERLEDLLAQREGGSWQKIRRLVIETTGLADPVPILQLFMAHPLFIHGFCLDGLITMVDAVNGMATLDHYEQSRRQVALADRIIVSKSDLILEDSGLNLLLARLRRLNQGAKILTLRHDQEIDMALLQNGLSKINFEQEQENHHHHHHATHHEAHQTHENNRHGESIYSFSLKCERPVSIMAMEAFLGALREDYGQKILRLKGMVITHEHRDRPLIIHGAQGLFHPPQFLPRWPDDSPLQTRLIFIVDGVAREEIEALFGAFSNQIGIDRADFQALGDNPLAIAGMRHL